jgi:2-keto-4-pentenoate hydratase/2-oxohepta-3-ene-1,7-dioic acid hydratase in catechol pathway
VKLSRIRREGPDGSVARSVAVLPDDDLVVDLRSAERHRLESTGASADAAQRLASAIFPGSLSAGVAAGPAFLRHVSDALSDPHEDAVLPMGDVTWIAAVDPPTMQDGSAFEQHLVNAHARGKRTVPDLFYEVPVYYKMNPLTVFGHDEEVPWPGGAGYMDYELEIAVVIGREGSDLRPEEARDHILGVTVMNDLSARDIQAKEMTAGFGPAKGKDFATSLGPWITTLDELDLSDLTMLARVNDEEWSRGSTASLTWSLEEIVAYLSRNEAIVPGQVIGSGTVGLGCGLELYRKLRPGDVVELEIEGIGTLRNQLAEPSATAWEPSPKERVAQLTLPTKDPAHAPTDDGAKTRFLDGG